MSLSENVILPALCDCSLRGLDKSGQFELDNSVIFDDVRYDNKAACDNFRWVHSVLQVKDSTEDTTTPMIICTNQVLRYTCYRTSPIQKSATAFEHQL
jgi:hypothetical protein